MTIFAVRGQGMKLVMDWKFIVKMGKFKNFDKGKCYAPQNIFFFFKGGTI